MEETIEKIKGNIKKYYFYQFFNNLVFFTPVIVLFWQSRGLNMTQIMTLQSIYSIAVIILEVPTGAFADRFGKKISLVFSSLLWGSGVFLYGLSSNFWQFALAEIICGTGAAFVSGADRAFIHETLKSLEKEKDYSQTEGRVRGFTQIGQSLGSILGGFIGSISFGLTLILTSFTSFVAFFVGLSFSKPQTKLDRDEKTNYRQIIRESLDIIRKNQQILWLALFFAIFHSLIWVTNWSSQPYFQMLKVPIVYFGLIFASFGLVAAIASAGTARLMKATGGQPFLIMSLTAVVSMFLLGSFPRILLIPLWSLFGALALINRTVVSAKTLTLVPADRGATVLSFQNLLSRLLYAAYGPIFGALSDSFGIALTLQINALILALVVGLLLLTEKRFKTNSEKI